MPPFVSVIIPTYNRNERVHNAVKSVCAQEFDDYELIIVDDGSEDETAGSLKSLVDKTKCSSKFIRHDLNCGAAKARNTGARNASGKWLSFLDSDDIWHKNKLAKQVEWVKQNPSYRIVQTREIWIRHGKRVNPPKPLLKKQGNIFKESLHRCMITISSVMIQNRLFKSIGGFNESLQACEDYDLWLRITYRYCVGLVDSHLVTRYGGNIDQLSARVGVLDRFRIRAILDLLSSHRLNEKQRMLARQILVRKANIVANGCKKRGKEKYYERYKKIADRFRL